MQMKNGLIYESTSIWEFHSYQAISASLEQILHILQPPPEHMMVVPSPSITSLPMNQGLDQTTNNLNDIKVTYVSEVEPR